MHRCRDIPVRYIELVLWSFRAGYYNERMNDESLCPFSKPIVGNYCACPHAILSERCSGKMSCTRDAELRSGCEELLDLFKTRAHFVLSMSSVDEELTHAQLMKIRCGGLLGMQRVLQMDSGEVPGVRDVMANAEANYGSVAEFAFSEIMPDIQNFNHRRKKRSTR